MNWLQQLDPLSQALVAGLFTWAVTAAGAAVVVVSGRVPGASFDAALGFASGVMLARPRDGSHLPAVLGQELD